MTVLTEVKTRPIIFSAPMVQSILSGKKSQTRRVNKGVHLVRLPQDVRGEAPISQHVLAPAGVHAAYLNPHGAVSVMSNQRTLLGVKPGEFQWVNRYGQSGERLWCKETFTLGAIPQDLGGAPQLRRGPLVGGKGPLKRWQQAAWYDGDDHAGGWFTERKRVSSIYMPRWASRLTLEITEIRVERLQAISEADAWAEGITEGEYRVALGSAVGAYSILWERMHGAGSWDANPWVFVVSFERVTA